MLIKRADFSDISFLLKVEESCFCPEDRFTWEFYVEIFLEPEYEIYIGYEDNRALGSLVLADLSKYLYITSVAILPEFRGRGYGKEFIKFSEKRAEELSLFKIKLHVRKSNKIAISFYEKMGYKRVLTLKNYYFDEDGYEYVKELKGG